MSPNAREQIARALAYAEGSHTLGDIERAVERGDMQLWEGERSAIVTEIRQTPRQKILLFFLAGGNLAELEAMTEPICEWGRMEGCDRAQLIGRRGWQRTFLTKHSWRDTAVLMEREL